VDAEVDVEVDVEVDAMVEGGSNFVHRQWNPHVEKPWNLWSYPELLWSNLWDQKNVELSWRNPLRSSSGRA
jgi:hypothetical protein